MKYEKEFLTGFTVIFSNTSIPLHLLFLDRLTSALRIDTKSDSNVFSKMFFTILSLLCDISALAFPDTVRSIPEKMLKIFAIPFVSVPAFASIAASASAFECSSLKNSLVFFNSPPAIICKKSALRAYLWVKSVAEMPVKPLHC